MSDPKPFNWNTEAQPFDWDKEAQAIPGPNAEGVRVEQPNEAPEEPGFLDKALYRASLMKDGPVAFITGEPSKKTTEEIAVGGPDALDALRSTMQNATLGYADELSAGAEAPITAISEGIPLKEAYKRGVAKYRPIQEEAVKKAPEMAIPAAMLTWELGGGSGGKEAAKQAATLGSRALNVVKGTGKAAVLGAIGGYGTAGDKDPGKQALEGAALTAALDLVLRGGASTISKSGIVNQYLRKKAEELALKAAGARGGIVNTMREMGYKTADEARQLGRAALEHDLIPFLGSKDAVLKRAGSLEEMAGATVGSVREAGQASGVPFNYDQAQAAAKARLANNSAVADRVSGPANDFIEDIATQSKKSPGDWNEAFKLKTDAQGGVNWSDKAKLGREIHRDAVRGYTEDLQKQVGDVLGQNELETLRSANDMYGVAKDVGELATNASTREAQNRTYGLIGTMMGVGAGASIGGAKGAAAGVLIPWLESFARRRGPAAGAVTLDKFQKLMSGKYAQSFAAAAQRGLPALTALHFILSQRDPEYRALMDDAPN